MYKPLRRSFCAYCFRSLGANHNLRSQVLNPSRPLFLSMLNGSMYFGRMMLSVVPFLITSGESQNGHLSAVTFGFKVDEAPQLSHFTVATVIFSAVLTCEETKVSKSISSTS